MIFCETPIPGVVTIALEPHEDERGFFARTWCRDLFRARGLSGELAQCSLSFTRQRGTLRGMHYQAPPHAEAKLVRCTAGALYDVAIDLRPNSPTFRQHVGVELTAQNRKALYVPEGCAHGSLTLADSTEVFYQISTPYVPAAMRGVRYDDPAFGIDWPEPVRAINDRDASFPSFEAAQLEPKSHLFSFA